MFAPEKLPLIYLVNPDSASHNIDPHCHKIKADISSQADYQINNLEFTRIS